LALTCQLFPNAWCSRMILALESERYPSKVRLASDEGAVLPQLPTKLLKFHNIFTTTEGRRRVQAGSPAEDRTLGAAPPPQQARSRGRRPARHPPARRARPPPSSSRPRSAAP